MKNQDIKNNFIVSLILEFSVLIIKYCEQIEACKKFIIANQMLRAGTSIGSNVWEAQNAESKIDFIHKFKIAAKEMEETKYWILLCSQFEQYPNTEKLAEKLDTIQKAITRIISIAKSRYVMKKEKAS